jgi:hypothetical protein
MWAGPASIAHLLWRVSADLVCRDTIGLGPLEPVERSTASKHEARRDPSLQFERSLLEVLELPPISRVQNRVEVLFDGAEPVVVP